MKLRQKSCNILFHFTRLRTIYKQKFWKIPIIYTPEPAYTLLQTIIKNIIYKDEFLNRQNNSDLNPELENTSSQDLIVLKDYYRRNRDVSYLLLLSYFINVIDASVITSYDF